MGEYDDAARDLGAVVAVVVEYCQVYPDDGVYAGVHACFEVFDGAVKAVTVCAGERRGSGCRCRLGKFFRP
ncbi:hypothetical protein AAU01_39060 [Paenarthrobacter aurescens]|uniref:Uncharacterized protein n=1 Tax=Paenarthrobacter aurescens TaxID=43663 RepID=A0A4Y3NQC9_PAEAU|nr:hypothetical protein AAU01_39060 [Paenarthrobacter aurescens]